MSIYSQMSRALFGQFLVTISKNKNRKDLNLEPPCRNCFEILKFAKGFKSYYTNCIVLFLYPKVLSVEICPKQNETDLLLKEKKDLN